MARLSTAKRRIAMAPSRRLGSTNVSVRRIAGRRNQERRLSAWQKDPHCAMCGRLVAYPDGFELDHVVPLYQGGPDTADNCQILCVALMSDGRKGGCHAIKTAVDVRGL